MDPQQSATESFNRSTPWGRRGMDGQATSKVETSRTKRSADVQGNFLALVRDGLKLADLQVQLLSLDLKEFFKRSRFAIFFLTLSAVGLLASTPIFLLSLAEFLRRTYELRMETALFAVGGISAILFSSILVFACWRLSRVSKVLSRSLNEMHANLIWARETIYSDESLE